MYKENLSHSLSRLYPSLLFCLVTILCLPTSVISRQRLTENTLAPEPTIDEYAGKQESTKHTTAKKPKPSKTTVRLKELKKTKEKKALSQAQDTKQAPSLDKHKTEKGDLVNEIAVLIYSNLPSQNSSDSKEFEKAPDVVLTRLDIERPSIDGRKRTLEELVMDHLMYNESTYFYRMVVPEDAVDKYINAIKEQHHISDDQLRGMFKEVGYTYEEGRQQLAMGQAIDSLLNFKIRSRLVVLEKDVRAYYDEHPEHDEASYKIKKGFIPDNLFTKDELENVTDAMMKNPAIQWSTSYWLLEDEIVEDRKEMLRALQEGSYSHLEPATGGYEVIRMITVKPRALKAFEDRYREISAVLQEPQYYRLLDELKKELLEKYEVVYFTA